jgi:hypothetical protein
MRIPLNLAGAFAILTVFFAGCTAFNTFPTAARPGETVALAVGSPDNLTKANINWVHFTSNSAPGSPIDITSNVRSVFRLYADKTSAVYQSPSVVGTTQLIRTSLHEPWVSVIVIDLPEEISPGVPLPTGPGQITINTKPSVVYPTIGSNINDLSIALEILPENQPTDGTASTFEYQFGTCCTQIGNLALLQEQPHALIKSTYTEDPFNLPNYAAIEMKVDFTGATSTPITDSNIYVVADDMNGYTNSNRQLITGVNNQVLTVMMLSLGEKLKPYEMRYSVVLKPGNSFTAQAPAITSTQYYDINGGALADATTYTVEIK